MPPQPKNGDGNVYIPMKRILIADYILRDPLLFGDYRNAALESEERYYEDLLDYQAIFFLFQEVS